MKNSRHETRLHAAALYVLALMFLLANLVFAHGPDGDHGRPASGAAASQAAVPRFEAATDLFELVAVLTGGELSILIDRFETNEPVLEAQVEVESGNRKAVARYRAVHSDYAVDDPALIAVLGQPGEHAIVIAVSAKDESDLLNGTLVAPDGRARIAADGLAHGDHDHDPALERVLIAVAGAVMLALIVVLWQRRRRKRQRGFATPQQVQP